MNPRPQRTVVTGFGALTGIGNTARETFDALCAGRPGARPVTLLDASRLHAGLAVEVPDLARHLPPGEAAERWSRCDLLALVAARAALAEAGVDGEGIDLVIGGSLGGMYECEARLAEMHTLPEEALGPEPAMLRHPYQMTAERLSEQLGPFRRARTVSSACSAGLLAVQLAAHWIASGQSTRVLVGGVDALSRLTFAGFDALRVCDPLLSRPFDVARAGINLGEGAGFLVLESQAGARARGATVFGELGGAAFAAEGFHITQPDPTGAPIARLVRRVLARSGLTAGQVGWVHAHGTGTPHNDPAEIAGLRAALSRDDLWVSSTKAQTGHTLSASGVLGLIAAILAMERGLIPPTAGLEEPDPACLPAHHLRATSKKRLDAALVNALGFGGLDAVALVARPGSLGAPPAILDEDLWVTGLASGGPWSLVRREGTADRLLGGGAPPAEAFDPGPFVDPGKTRRMNRFTLSIVAALGEALADAELPATSFAHTGAVLGSAFGSTEACAEYLHKSEQRGWRSPNFAAFTGLVPSSPAANAALVLGLQGPVLSVADLGVSAETALETASELLLADEARAICVLGSCESTAIDRRVWAPLCLDPRDETVPHREHHSALVLERADEARRRGARPLARLRHHRVQRGGLPTPPPPRTARPRVFVTWPEQIDWLAHTAWAHLPAEVVTARAGRSEAAGGMTLAAAVSAVATGQASEALAVGGGPDRWAVSLLDLADP